MSHIQLHIAILFTICTFSGTSQIVCADVAFEPSTSIQEDLVFDNFNDYSYGIIRRAVARVRIRVDDQIPSNPNCKWKLNVTVDNNAGAGTANTDWETITTYSGSSNPPPISIFEFRITNACATSPIHGTYQSFTLNGDVIDIIQDTGVQTAAGSCTTNTNGPGSYLDHYDEFVFAFDIRIVPGLVYDPGIYALQFTFNLEEVP